MDTMAFARSALIAAALVAGCGGETAMLIEADAGTGGAAGQVAETGGQAGGVASGTGGAPAAGGTIGTTFTSADHDMCAAWPVCPVGVNAYSFNGTQVRPDTCRLAFDGARMNCGTCSDSTGVFVGRCIAPMLNESKVSVGWILCTGFGYPSDTATKNYAQIVCEG